MAIQLSERDNLIFKLIDEHQVLLEKHIAWFISCDEKPVLIRDRLRKLFYLDYLLCERHGGKLPWWTTPTKPLVYMLSPMTRQIVKSDDSTIDLTNCESQRHLLEVANIRMLFMVDQKDGIVSDLEWKTVRRQVIADGGIDAVVSFKRNGVEQRIGIVNHPTKAGAELANIMQTAISQEKLDNVWVVSRDDAHQGLIQKSLLATSVAGKVVFTNHQEVYKSGMVRAKWQSVNAIMNTESVTDRIAWGGNLTPAQAF